MSYEQISNSIKDLLRMIQLIDLIKAYNYSNQPNIAQQKLIEHKDQLQRQHSKVIESLNEIPVAINCFDILNSAMISAAQSVDAAELSQQITIYKATTKDVFLSLQRRQYIIKRNALAFIPERNESAYNNRDARDEDGYPGGEHQV